MIKECPQCGYAVLSNDGACEHCKPEPAPAVCSVADLFAAHDILKALGDEMDAEFQKFGAEWDRDWMQNHINARATLINARKVLLDRAEIRAGQPNANLSGPQGPRPESC